MHAKKFRVVQPTALAVCFAVGFLSAVTLAGKPGAVLSSKVVSQKEAKSEEAEWGVFHTYYEGETYGTKDVLTGVAVIKPGKEIHPPHQHAEEEYLMVTEGQGTWHLNGKTFAAQKGDILYATPWDWHGITNTGATPLTFVVWKWNNKGVDLPAQPDDEKK